MIGARFISPSELEKIMPMVERGEYLLLDIRTIGEFRSGHIRCARLIPVEEIEQRSGELDKEKRLVIYCRTGKRCLRAVSFLGKDRAEVLILEGGLEQWPYNIVCE